MLLRVLAAIAAVSWAGAVSAAAPLTAYGRLPAVEQVTISPAGDRLAYVGVEGETRRLGITQLSDGRTLASLGVGSHKVRDLKWAGSDYVMIGVSMTDSLPGTPRSYEQYNVIGFDLKSKSFATFLDPGEYRGSTSSRLNRGARVPRLVLGDPVPGVHAGQTTAFVSTINLANSGSRDLFRIDLRSGAPYLHERGSGDTLQWVVLPNGRAVAREEYDYKSGRWRLLIRRGAAWAEAKAEGQSIERSNLVGLGRTDDTLAVSTLIEGERRLVEVSMADGKVSAPIDRGPGDGLVTDPVTGRLIGTWRVGAVRQYRFFDPKLDAAWKSVTRGFPRQQVSLVSWTPDYRKLVVLAEGDRQSGTYYLVDVASRKADVIGEAYPEIGPDQVGPTRAVSYKAQDGLEITGYLTLPPGGADKNLPLVVLPHGGPASRDLPGFDWWAQALASRGYAVLQPNFRGSAGFGQSFLEAGYGQWGRKMQTDLSDGVRHLASQGVVDPKRVCIVGASYGGYAALAGATLEPDMYRCAVSVAGVSDLARMLQEEAGEARTANTASVRYWSRQMGASFRDRRSLDVVSPARQAAAAKAPILLIHARDDTVVPFAQSAVMAQALRAAGKPVELVTLQGEDHWLSRGATRQQMLNATVRFLEQHNPPR